MNVDCRNNITVNDLRRVIENESNFKNLAMANLQISWF